MIDALLIVGQVTLSFFGIIVVAAGLAKIGEKLSKLWPGNKWCALILDDTQWEMPHSPNARAKQCIKSVDLLK